MFDCQKLDHNCSIKHCIFNFWFSRVEEVSPEIVDSVEEVVSDDGSKVSTIDNIHLFVLNLCDVCLCVKYALIMIEWKLLLCLPNKVWTLIVFVVFFFFFFFFFWVCQPIFGGSKGVGSNIESYGKIYTLYCK